MVNINENNEIKRRVNEINSLLIDYLIVVGHLKDNVLNTKNENENTQTTISEIEKEIKKLRKEKKQLLKEDIKNEEKRNNL